MKAIVLTGGGTAGHVMPHLALLPRLKEEFDKIYYFGTSSGIEKGIIKQVDGINYVDIKAVKFLRKLTLKNLTIPFKLISAINDAKRKLKEIKPCAVFSKGGFVAVPVCIAAKKLGIPVISHESDLSMGLANKIIYRFCVVMCTGFEKTAEKRKKCVWTGSPIRKELLQSNKKISFPNGRGTILIFGGSLGAKQINDFVHANISMLTEKYNVIHIVGKNNLDNNIKISNYIQLEWSQEMGKLYNSADMVISRSGANTLCELLALAKPMLLIPLPKDQSRGDQIENAEFYQEKGYASVLMQNQLTLNKLLEKISYVLNNKERFVKKMTQKGSFDSCEKIIDIIKENVLKE